jgi:hypothetical protein
MMKFKLTIALFLILVPSLAYARTRTAGARMRPQFHDRTPKAHIHGARPHLSR